MKNHLKKLFFNYIISEQLESTGRIANETEVQSSPVKTTETININNFVTKVDLPKKKRQAVQME